MMTYSPMGARREFLQSQINEAQRQLMALQKLPQVDDYEPGTIIRVEVRLNGDELTYVLLKVGGAERFPNGIDRWYYTGRLADARHQWTRWNGIVNSLTRPGVEIISWEVVWPR